MSVAVTVVVGIGIALTVSVGLVAGLDAYAAVVLGLILAFGWLAISVARRSGGRTIAPADCPECGGIGSPNAPYCKHCGTRLR
ncbi:MAG: zinc ribbon domain-containing protein [Actinomycetota bacterium]|nr:zinc ribbon domain-containing protein [Actinomycetota bacterium]